MAKVRVRSETGTLYLDFTYRGIRCREQTALPDTAGNRQKVERLLARIQRDILQGTFDYADVFPGSSKATQFAGSGPSPRSELVTASHSAVETPALAEFVRLWITESEPQWRASYQTTVRNIVDKDLIPKFGSQAVGDISKADILEFRAELSKRPCRDGTLGPARINKILGILRQVLNEASERFEFQPAFRNIKPLRIPKSDVMPFTLDEVEQLLETVRPDYRDYLITRFFTGMRSGEINGLQWRFVDLENKLISVRETIVNGNIEKFPKTDASVRDIPMSPRVYTAIKAQQALREPECPWVFHTRAGNPIDTKNFANRVWHPLLRYLKLEKRRPYQTRHTAATLMLAAGESPEWVARMLGHANTEMLFRVYSRYVPNLTRNDGRAFAGLLSEHEGRKRLPLTEKYDIDKMSPPELREALKALSETPNSQN